MRVLLPLKKKGNHQHQHLEDHQEEEGEEHHLEPQEPQQQQPLQAAEEASYSYTEPGSDPAPASTASALSVGPVASTTASTTTAAAVAATSVFVPAAAPVSPRSLLAVSSNYTEPPEPSKKRARAESTSASATATALPPNGNSKPAARHSVSVSDPVLLPVPPVLPLPTGNSNHTDTNTNTNTQAMAGGRRYSDADGDDDDWRHQGSSFVSSSAAATANRVSLTTASTPPSSPTSRAAAVAAAPLENEAPPNNGNNNNNHIYYNYRTTNSTRGSTTSTSSSNSPSVARSAASASHHSIDPAIDTVYGYDVDDGKNNNSDNNDQVSESFRKDLKKRGLEIVQQEGDGNCLFRAVSLQVYGDSSMHADVRQQCLDFMARDVEHFGQFVVGEDFGDYIARKRQSGVHGNHTEIQAVSELFNRPVEVFTPASAARPLNIFHAEYKTADAPIRLSYHDGNHYNAVIDPFVPTAGLGLGLPGLKPGLADQMQVAKAVAESDQLADDMEFERVLKESARDNDDLQRALKESAYDSQYDKLYKSKTMDLSDLDATNFELEQKVLESSMESYRRQEAGRKQRASPTLGRRRRGRISPAAIAVHERNLPAFGTSPVAAIPPPPPAAAAAASSVASVASAASADSSPLTADEYPQTVQELVMNGFELGKVVHAYELIGDNFDDLLTFLMSNSSS